MALNINKLVVQFLKDNSEKRYTARQIAQWIFDTFPSDIEEKRQNSTAKVIPLTTDNAMITQIVAEIGSQRPAIQKKYKNVKTTDSRPRLYYYTESEDTDEILLQQPEENSKESDFLSEVVKLSEHDLYPILSSYLESELGIHSKRINEKKSSNSRGSGGNHWLFPDMVAMENLSENWHPEIREFSKLNSDRWTRLWSFEVKRKINRANVRESFFQAVSNSSWANFGYLVASEVNEAATHELRILCALHGIGVIVLNPDNPSESSILIPAKEKPDIDWNTANRLATENSDFVDFIEAVKHFYQTGKVKQSDWKF